MALASSRTVEARRIIDLRPGPRRRIKLFVLATAGAGIVTLVIAMWLGGNLTQSINGLVVGGTGNLTGWGLSASKMVMEVASVGVIGLLVACLLLPEPDGEPSATVLRCRRSATQLAVVWAIANAALLVFTWSDVVDVPVARLPFAKLFTAGTTVFPDALDYISSTAVAVVIAVGVAVTERRRGALLLLLLASYNLVPMALQGHASHGTVLKYSLIVHVIAVSLWVGGLAALLLHVRQEPALLAVAVPRFSKLALGCYLVVAATGIVAAWILLGSVPALWGSRYGVLVMLKAAALIALGILGWWHRRHTVDRIRTSQDDARVRRAFIQLAAAEIVIMVIAVALAVALSSTASPDTIILHGNQ
jgi:putative copper resistance protein D